MADLIDIRRATQSPNLATVAAASPAYVASLISAASVAIQRYCHRDFTLTTYTEYYSGGIYIREPLWLRHYPVTNIADVSIANNALLVQNTGTAQKATVQTLSNGDVKLVSVSSAVTTSTTLAAATYLTIGSLATAINAVSGWSTAIYSGAAGSYSNFPTTDLKTLQGAVSAKVGGAYLDIYEPWYGWNNAAGWSDEDCGSIGNGWRLEDDTGGLFGHFPRGQLNIRVTYTAGYSLIPADVQEACVQMTQALYDASQANSAYSSVRLGDASVVLAQRIMPKSVAMLLARYVAHDKVIGR